jgi:2-polyprenyl-3-methyl-5-hydroxy-6-metoxy-1,4-benzoquinol methylase
MNNEQRLQEARQLWDDAAATFDNEPDHGLHDPGVRNAWITQLQRWLPPQPAAILDIGCGTGSLSVVLAALGHQVTAIDLSPAMIAQAEAKARAAGLTIAFGVTDAAYPQFGQQQFDLILCRHLLWALPDPASVLQRWVALLAPGGRLVLIEGFWHTGAGLHAQQVVSALPASVLQVTVESLSDQPALWGGPVTDERYAVVADMLASFSK